MQKYKQSLANAPTSYSDNNNLAVSLVMKKKNKKQFFKEILDISFNFMQSSRWEVDLLYSKYETIASSWFFLRNSKLY